MTGPQPVLDALAFGLGDGSGVPMYRKLRERLIAEIGAGVIKPGMRMPSSRLLARTLGVSRGTVILAFEELVAEGYLFGHQGSGTFVAPSPPQAFNRNLVKLSRERRVPPSRLTRPDRLNAFTSVPERLRVPRKPVPFKANFPALDLFPIELWAKLTARAYRRHQAGSTGVLLGEADAQGHPPLRAAIAEHLKLSRGMDCAAHNVIIFAGAQQAIDVVCRVLLSPGDHAWCEDPGYEGAYASIAAAAGIPDPIPVDGEGLIVSAGMARSEKARMAFVCPSKHFPLGMEMSMARRAELLDWADRNEAWIIEDDYDNEFRFSGRALPPLHALDGGERVIYVGTFSKVLFPSLRLGFAVVPEWLVDAFVAARAVVGRYSPLLDQILVAEFMLEGHYASHLARMRKVYAERQAFMLECAASELAGFATLEPTETGMQLLATVADDFDPDAVAVAAHERGLEIYPVSWFAVEQHSPAALLMGFSAFSPKQIESGLQTLRTCFEIQHRRSLVR